MKGFRFYLEYPNKQEKQKATRKKTGNHSGNCIALCVDPMEYWINNDNTMVEAFTAVYDRKNSPCCFSSTSIEYLNENCKRISEQQARVIHPNLFERIEL